MQRTAMYSRPRAEGRGDSMTWLGNGLATILAGLAVASGVIGTLVAFGQIGDTAEPFEDGMVWMLGGLILAISANVFRREHHVVGPAGAATAEQRERGRLQDAERPREHVGVRDVKDLMEMNVVATNEAIEVGTVRDVLFDPTERAILGLMVAPAGSRDSQMFVARDYIRGFGRDAVTIQSESNLQTFATKGREREFAGAGVHLDGMRVMTEQGDDVGKIGKVMVDRDCNIAEIEAGGGVLGGARRIDAEDVVSIGQDRVIVSRVREK